MANRRLFSCLVLALCSLSVLSADVFVNIDCGSSALYKDENGIVWTGDDKYVQSGESRSVQSSDSISDVMDTLRVFTTRIKNCYYVDSVEQGRVLVRATFYYGNYDGKSSPPTFDLQFDGNHWTTVRTSNSQPVGYEVIYVMKRDSISICVAQTNPGQFPFISALEIRSFESFMYQKIDASYPLFTRKRVAFGSNATIRYQDDPYDRIWSPDAFSNATIQVSSNALFSKQLQQSNLPPPAVLKHAITTISPNNSIVLFMDFPSDEIPVYINWYFSEVTQLKPNETRSFKIVVDNKISSLPILPPYDNCTVMFASNVTVSSNTTYSLVPTNDSTLPPLINAMEVFLVGDELTNGTNRKDVQGLASLRKAFAPLQSWSGDPCLPASYTWDWLNCSYDDPTPRATTLFLGSFGLSGLLPDFSSMDALHTIDLHNNSLQGPIPDFLGTLPNLKILNLANNQFNGTIPASLSTKKGLTLVVTGNPDLCTSNTSCPISSKTPALSSSMRKKNKNIVQTLFGTITLSFIILNLR